MTTLEIRADALRRRARRERGVTTEPLPWRHLNTPERAMWLAKATEDTE